MSDQPQYPRYPGEDPEPSDPGPGATQDLGQGWPHDPRQGQGQAQEQGQQPPPPPSYGQSAPSYGQAPPAYGQQPPVYGQTPPGYAYPQQGYGYQQRPQTSTKAVLGLVFGIVSILFCYVGLLIGPVAIVLSVLARKEIDDAPHGTVEGRGMAIAGLATGIIGTLIWAAVIALIVSVSIT